MNEEEALTKWCPFARISVTRWYGDPPLVAATATTNRIKHTTNPEDLTLANCIGSACMAFRTEVVTTAIPDTETLKVYCGLAGRP